MDTKPESDKPDDPVRASTDVAIIDEGEGFLAKFRRKATDAITSIGDGTEEDRLLRVNALSPADRRITQAIAAAANGERAVVEVKHYLIHVVERIDVKTGEVNQGLRVVLIGPDETRMVSSSKAVAEMLMHAANVYGAGPWNPPLRLEVWPMKGASGFDYTAAKLLPRMKPVEKAGKKK